MVKDLMNLLNEIENLQMFALWKDFDSLEEKLLTEKGSESAAVPPDTDTVLPDTNNFVKTAVLLLYFVFGRPDDGGYNSSFIESLRETPSELPPELLEWLFNNTKKTAPDIIIDIDYKKIDLDIPQPSTLHWFTLQDISILRLISRELGLTKYIDSWNNRGVGHRMSI